MEKRINIAELLKDCSTGMELDCTMYDNVTYTRVSSVGAYPIKIETPDGQVSLDKYGCYSSTKHAKCVIFPKGKTTWEGFVPPYEFKDGDIITCTKCGYSFVAIFKKQTKDFIFQSYAMCTLENNPFVKLEEGASSFINPRPATEEEREAIFQAIKDSGYKWNAETKTLEKLVIKPKFKVGDKIRQKNQDEVCLISEVWDNLYLLDKRNIPLPFCAQDDWELVPNKFDVSTLIPFESRVLVRDSDVGIWLPEFFGCLCDGNDYPYMIVGGTRWKCCIPYEGNEHLLNTTDDCDEYYKTWED